MRVKRYTAPTIQEAIALVKHDLGREAVILNTRHTVCGGLFGLFGRRAVEVVAAGEARELKKSESATVKGDKNFEEPCASLCYEQEAIAGRKAFDEKPTPGLDHLQKDLGELKELLKDISQKMNRKDWAREIKPLEAYKAKYMQYFIEQELPERMVEEYWFESRENISWKGLREKDKLSDFFAKRAKTGFSPAGLPKGQVITFVGPTGVGKTTTIAKVAANAVLFERKKVSLITIDTYRIAAAEQLRIYGEIMDLPVEVVYNPQEFVQVVANNQDKDLIIVDTAGRSQNNKTHLAELKQFLSAVPFSINFLVLSPATRQRDLKNIYRQFSFLSLHGLVFTKLDETNTFGSLLTLPQEANLPVTYMTNGQNVPDDIEIATAKRIASLLVENFPDE